MPARQPTPAPFASSLSRNLLTRALGKPPQHTPHFPDVEPKSFFFDDDDEDDVLDRRLFPQTRRISITPARPNSRLSSAFAAAPTLFGLSSPSVSTPSLIPEKHGVVRPESRAKIVHKQASKSSLKLRLRTKLSLPKLASPRSNLSSPSTDPSPVTPSYHSHPYSAVFADSEHTYPCRASLGDRLITPDEDPFRKDEIVPYFLANSRPPSSSPRSGSLDSDSEADKHSPMYSSRWSFDSDSSPSSHNHTPVTGGRPGFTPSPGQYEDRVSAKPLQSASRSPLSLTFPLPPSSQKSASFPGVTVRVTTHTPGPPPAYPPPRTPPPSGPLPSPPPADTSRARSSARTQKGVVPRRRSGTDFGKLTPTRHTQRGRSPLQMDRPLDPFLSRNKLIHPPLKERSDVAKRTQQKSAPRRRDRPVTPFPLLLPVGRSEPVTAGRLEASDMATRFICPRENSAFDQGGDAIPDSETEPDRDFDFEKARKKTSICSATSAQTTESSLSTTSASTTTTFVSVVTTMTAATTVSPSTSPQMSTTKPPHVSQVLITDEEGRIVSAATYGTPSSWPPSPPHVCSDASSPGISIEQGGIVGNASSDLFLVPGELVIVGASSWTEFRNYCDTCHVAALCLASNPYGNGIVDVLAVETQHAGETRGVELRIVARTPSPRTSADFQGRIPGTYPLSSDSPSLLSVIPCISPIDIPQSTWGERRKSALGLDGVPPLNTSRSGLTLGNHLDPATDDRNKHGPALAFTATLPTTLRDLVKRAEGMNLIGEVVVP